METWFVRLGFGEKPLHVCTVPIPAKNKKKSDASSKYNVAANTPQQRFSMCFSPREINKHMNTVHRQSQNLKPPLPTSLIKNIIKHVRTQQQEATGPN